MSKVSKRKVKVKSFSKISEIFFYIKHNTHKINTMKNTKEKKIRGVTTGERLRLFLDDLQESGKVASQVDFATQINRDESYISQLLNDRRSLPVRFAKYLYDLYGISVSWLIHGTGERYEADNKLKIIRKVKNTTPEYALTPNPAANIIHIPDEMLGLLSYDNDNESDRESFEKATAEFVNWSYPGLEIGKYISINVSDALAGVYSSRTLLVLKEIKSSDPVKILLGMRTYFIIYKGNKMALGAYAGNDKDGKVKLLILKDRDGSKSKKKTDDFVLTIQPDYINKVFAVYSEIAKQ